MRKPLILVAIVILGRVAFAPPAFGAAASASITQAEAENFIGSFYRDMERDDLDKMMAHFDQTVRWYDAGPKDQAFVADELQQYCAGYPSRSFSIGGVTLKGPERTIAGTRFALTGRVWPKPHHRISLLVQAVIKPAKK